MKLKLFVFILGLTLLNCGQTLHLGISPSKSSDSTQTSDLHYLKLCEQYIHQYTPLYIMGGDTMVVANFNYVPDSLNTYLLNCTKKKDYRALKYAATLSIRQHYEFIKVNNEEYIIQDCLIQENGFIALIRSAMGFSDEEKFGELDYFNVFSGEIVQWVRTNKDKIEGYEFVEEYLRNRLK